MGLQKFALKTLVFILPLAVLFYYVEYRIAHIPNTYNTKRSYLEKQKDSIEVLVTGNSHALFGIAPQYFSHKGFNVANASQSLFYDKAITLKYLPQLKALKLVIIPVDYFSLYYSMNDVKEYWRNFYYYRYWGLIDEHAPMWDIRRYSLIMLYGTEEVLHMMKHRFRENYAAKMQYSGYMLPDAGNVKDINDSTGKARAYAHYEIIKTGKHQYILKELEQMVGQLTARQIKVVLITTPVYHTYYRYCDKLILAKNTEELEAICSKYSCTYRSYLTDRRFSINDFNDNDHLNVTGARRFSLLLDSEVVRPALGADAHL